MVLIDSDMQKPFDFSLQQSVKLPEYSVNYTLGPSEINNHWAPKKRTRTNFNIEYKRSGTVKFENIELLKQVGTRMREARELCGFSLSQAAKLLGYKNPSKLCKVEQASDTMAIPLWLILRASKLYDVTTDYIFGLTDDWERDPVVYQQKQVGVWLLEHFENSKKAELNALRVLHNRQWVIFKAINNFLSRSKENMEYAKRVREMNPEFDEMKGGNRMMWLLEQTENETMALAREMEKIKVLARVAQKDNVNLDLFESQDVR